MAQSEIKAYKTDPKDSNHPIPCPLGVYPIDRWKIIVAILSLTCTTCTMYAYFFLSDKANLYVWFLFGKVLQTRHNFFSLKISQDLWHLMLSYPSQKHLDVYFQLARVEIDVQWLALRNWHWAFIHSNAWFCNPSLWIMSNYQRPQNHVRFSKTSESCLILKNKDLWIMSNFHRPQHPFLMCGWLLSVTKVGVYWEWKRA